MFWTFVVVADEPPSTAMALNTNFPRPLLRIITSYVFRTPAESYLPWSPSLETQIPCCIDCVVRGKSYVAVSFCCVSVFCCVLWLFVFVFSLVRGVPFLLCDCVGLGVLLFICFVFSCSLQTANSRGVHTAFAIQSADLRNSDCAMGRVRLCVCVASCLVWFCCLFLLPVRAFFFFFVVALNFCSVSLQYGNQHLRRSAGTVNA